MNIGKMIILFMIFQTIPVYSADESAMYIDLLTTNPPLHSFVLTDSLGRKTGIRSFVNGTIVSSEEFNEIPNSYAAYEGSPGDAVSELPSVTGRVMIGVMKEVLSSSYTLTVYSFMDGRYILEFHLMSISGKWTDLVVKSVSRKGDEQSFFLSFDPTPGAPPPVLTKVVTFQTLRDDFNVAQKLNQIGDDKFVRSLIRMVDIAEMISKRCDKLNDKAKHRCYRPVVVILRMVVKRLEVVNRLCDNQTDCKPKCKVSKECDEDEALKMFESKYRKNDDLKDFFDSWDKDEWHKHKKKCKKFVTDEALEIISADVNWLIKSFGEEVFDNYKKEHEPYIPEKYKNFFK